MSKYTLSHKLSLPDGLIAATAIVQDVPLYTLNIKDFKYIQGLRPHRLIPDTSCKATKSPAIASSQQVN